MIYYTLYGGDLRGWGHSKLSKRGLKEVKFAFQSQNEIVGQDVVCPLLSILLITQENDLHIRTDYMDGTESVSAPIARVSIPCLIWFDL